jgi:hypothetical protein
LNRADTAIDGDLLVVAGRLTRHGEARLEKTLRRGCVGRPVRRAKTTPQVGRAWKRIGFSLDSGGEVELHDAFSIRGVGERQPQNLGVFLGLLEAVAGRLVVSLRFDDGDRMICRVSQEVVGALPALACGRAASDDDPARGEVALLVDRMGRLLPARRLKTRDNVLPAGIRFVRH